MQIEYLYYFLDVAKTLSISQSARTLYISPQGLSRAIKSLEEEFGFELFARTKHGFVLTKEGEEFVVCAKQFLKYFEEFLDKSRNISPIKGEGMSENITFYTTTLFSVSGVIIEILDFLAETAPSSKFLIKEQLPMCAIKNITKDQNYCIGLINIPQHALKEFTLPAGFSYDYLLEISMVAYVGPNSKYANKKIFDKQELAALPLACFSETLAEDCVRYMLEDYGEPNIVISSSDARLSQRIAFNQNVVNLSVNLAKTSQQNGRIAIPIRDTLKLAVILFYRNSQKENPSMKAVISSVKSYLLAHYPHLAATEKLIS